MNTKFAVVTGASTGIGRAIAVALSNIGYTLALCGRNKEGLKITKQLVAQDSPDSEIYLVDLADVTSINTFITGLKHKTNNIHALINVAGIWHDDNGVFANKTYESFLQKTILDTFAVGITAPALLAHAFIPLMPEHAVIVNISGTFENGAKGWLPYYVSKRAIEDLTVGLSQELQEKNIHVYGISPSDTATEQYKKYFPEYIKDAIDPKDIAAFLVQNCCTGTLPSGSIYVLKKNTDPYSTFHT